MPHHCTHEHFALFAPSGDLLLHEYWSHRFDDETLHLVQQYVAALIHALCAMTGAPTPPFARLAMTPHPDHGLDHLAGHFGVAPSLSAGRRLEILIPAFVADHAFPGSARQRPQRPPPEWSTLAGEGGFMISVRIVIAAILGEAEVNMEQVAAAAGMSTRTLQRRLAADGVTFSVLVGQVRKDEAIRALRVDGASLAEIAERLGYANQSTLTRAVRRWTGLTPTQLRREGPDAK
jgi:AraC-like DNA-binding protein